MLYVGVGKGAQSLDKSWKIHVNSPSLFSLPTPAPSPPRSICLSFPLTPSAPAHILSSWCYIIILQALSRKEKMLQERGTSVKYPLERFHHANYYWSFSLSAPHLHLTVLLSTSHCMLPFLLEPCEIDWWGAEEWRGYWSHLMAALIFSKRKTNQG